MGNCYRCKINQTGEPEKISFEYAGLKFSSFKNGSTCEQCEKKEIIRKFEEFGKEFISLKNGELKMDWKFYSQAHRKERDSHLAGILICLGIFSYKSEKNWEIVANGPIGMNPRYGLGSYLYFTREKDVVEFARLNFSGTLYFWQIRQIGKTISQKEVLELK